MVVFDCPVGAPADVAELEYISALQQTLATTKTTDDDNIANQQQQQKSDTKLRSDATVTAEDVRYYLVSRHGIRRSTSELQHTVFHELAASRQLLLPQAPTRGVGRPPTTTTRRGQKTIIYGHGQCKRSRRSAPTRPIYLSTTPILAPVATARLGGGDADDSSRRGAGGGVGGSAGATTTSLKNLPERNPGQPMDTTTAISNNNSDEPSSSTKNNKDEMMNENDANPSSTEDANNNDEAEGGPTEK
jgi:hypothetical protein